MIGIILEKLTATTTDLNAIEQLALIIAIRKATGCAHDEKIEEKIRKACRVTGLIDFIKHCCRVVLNQATMQNEEEAKVNYYFRIELLWILTNIHASLDSNTDFDCLQTLWLDSDNVNDLTAAKQPSPIFDLIASALIESNSMECQEMAVHALSNGLSMPIFSDLMLEKVPNLTECLYQMLLSSSKI